MTLPLSPNTSYSAGTPPPVHADDLNAIQQYLAGLYTAGYSVKALVVDGTGGASVVPVPGTATVSATLSGTAQPTTTVPAGTFGRGGVAVGWAVVKGNGTLVRGYNIRGINHFGTGEYVIELNVGLTDTNHVAVLVTPDPGLFPTVGTGVAEISFTGRVVVDVEIFALNGSWVDSDFSVLIFGE